MRDTATVFKFIAIINTENIGEKKTYAPTPLLTDFFYLNTMNNSIATRIFCTPKRAVIYGLIIGGGGQNL